MMKQISRTILLSFSFFLVTNTVLSHAQVAAILCGSFTVDANGGDLVFVNLETKVVLCSFPVPSEAEFGEIIHRGDDYLLLSGFQKVNDDTHQNEVIEKFSFESMSFDQWMVVGDDYFFQEFNPVTGELLTHADLTLATFIHGKPGSQLDLDLESEVCSINIFENEWALEPTILSVTDVALTHVLDTGEALVQKGNELLLTPTFSSTIPLEEQLQEAEPIIEFATPIYIKSVPDETEEMIGIHLVFGHNSFNFVVHDRRSNTTSIIEEIDLRRAMPIGWDADHRWTYFDIDRKGRRGTQEPKELTMHVHALDVVTGATSTVVSLELESNHSNDPNQQSWIFSTALAPNGRYLLIGMTEGYGQEKFASGWLNIYDFLDGSLSVVEMVHGTPRSIEVLPDEIGQRVIEYAASLAP